MKKRFTLSTIRLVANQTYKKDLDQLNEFFDYFYENYVNDKKISGSPTGFTKRNVSHKGINEFNPRLAVYAKRNKIIRTMGFESYEKYLKSKIWFNIRKKLLTKHKRCQKCGLGLKLVVHHADYTNKNLRGKNNYHLYVICNACHESIHRIENGEDISLHDATKKYMGEAWISRW